MCFPGFFSNFLTKEFPDLKDGGNSFLFFRIFVINVLSSQHNLNVLNHNKGTVQKNQPYEKSKTNFSISPHFI